MTSLSIRFGRRVFSPLLALNILCIAGGPLWAQAEGTITGVVRDAGTQRPLANVQVFVEGTGVGSLTSQNGSFQLRGVPTGEQVISVRSIGYGVVRRTVNVAPGEPVTANFEVRPSALELDEVVVSGAGVATERRRLGNTIATVDVGALQDAPVSNISEILTGREPGMMSLADGGSAGSGARIRIRGSASLSQSNEPVVYVDGVRVDNSGGLAPGITTGALGGGGGTSRLDDLNPDAIERIEILKGAAAATLYGTEASNGVIQIFTKRGLSGAPQYDVSVEQGLTRQPQGRMPPLAGFVLAQDPTRRPHGTDLGTTGVRERYGIDVQPFEVFEVPGASRVFSTGRSQTYSVSVRGGSEAVTYFVSGRYHTEDGPLDGSELNPPAGFTMVDDESSRAQFNANLEFFPWDDLRVRVTSRYADVTHETPEDNNNTESAFGLVIMGKPEVANENNIFGNAAFATAREAFLQRNVQDVRRFGGSLSAGYTLTPTVSLDATLGLDVTSQQGYKHIPFGWAVDEFTGRTPEGFRRLGHRNHRELTVDLKASWDTQFGSDVSSELVAGIQGLMAQTRNQHGTGQEFAGPGLEVVGAGFLQNAFESYLEQAQLGLLAQYQLGWRDWIFPTVGARIDEHSAFGETAGAALYPKASISVIPSSRPSWTSHLLSTLRFRSAVGTSGLQPGAFDQFTTFAPISSSEGPGAAPANLGNPDLRPESSLEWEVGAEAGLWGDRVSVDLTYWDRTVTDVLVARQFAPSGGFRAAQLDNIGRLDAHGVDVALKFLAVSRPNLSLDVFANGAYLREVVADLGGAPPFDVGGSRERHWIREGFAPGAFFGAILDESVELPIHRGDCQPMSEAELLQFLSVPRNPSQINPLVVDCGNPNMLNHYLGKPTPDWQGGFGGDVLLWGNFSVQSLFEYRVGDIWHHDIAMAFRRENPTIGRNLRESAEIEAVLLNPASTAEQRLAAANTWVRELKGMAPYRGLNAVRRSDFVRFRELSLTYRPPFELAERVGARNLAVTLAGRNIGLWTRYDGTDPEASMVGRQEGTSAASNFVTGTSHYGYGIPMTFTLSVRAGF